VRAIKYRLYKEKPNTYLLLVVRILELLLQAKSNVTFETLILQTIALEKLKLHVNNNFRMPVNN
jgi:hypothetical protein